MVARSTLRKGSKGSMVTELQKLLNTVLSPTPLLKLDGDYGENTKQAVLAFQRKAKIKVDGVVGKDTWEALAVATSHKSKSAIPTNTLADIAAKYIGVTETGDNLAGSSKELLAIFKADNVVSNGRTDGYPWCAAFVSFCVQELCKKSGLYGALIPPREASVHRFLNTWAKQNNCLVFKPDSEVFTAMKGDIVVFTFSHIGIVESNNGKMLTTIEGNTNAVGGREGTTVARKNRPYSIIKSIIRIPMTTIGIEKQLKNAVQYC